MESTNQEKTNPNSDQFKELAVGKESIPHKRVLTPQEKEALRVTQLDKLIQVDTLKDEIEALVKPKKETIKQIETAIVKERQLLKDGFERLQKECYLVPNLQTEKMDYVDIDTGEVLYERKLTPDEKQYNIAHMRVA